ncbi:M14 family metallopeptidase [Flavobacteriaceae bacterium]|nr:M14 family metallopeptidase [Flavobacteriaceae bacterium]
MKKSKFDQSRLLSPATLNNFLKENALFDSLSILGTSVEHRPIYSYTVGKGSKKILMWSQMHGNESTTTKALVEFWLYLKTPEAKQMRDACTFLMIPQLNPDGSDAYTRVNANTVDLNRDAIDLSQPESRILRELYQQFKPDYCFNLHGQRTIFAAGNSQIPATVSFLAPAADQDRTITPAREKAMKLIALANAMLQERIPGAVGRYDDGFNINCVGDYFTAQNTPTILFEAGHFPLDYKRVETKKHIFNSLVTMSQAIASDSIERVETAAYFEIPENKNHLRDIELYNLKKAPNGKPVLENNLLIQFKEVKKDNDIDFIPEIVTESKGLHGMQRINAQEHKALMNLCFEAETSKIENLTKSISLLSLHQFG